MRHCIRKQRWGYEPAFEGPLCTIFADCIGASQQSVEVSGLARGNKKFQVSGSRGLGGFEPLRIEALIERGSFRHENQSYVPLSWRATLRQ